MTLKSVPGGSQEKPLWDRAFIPLRKEKKEREVTAATKITSAQQRFIDVLIQSGKHPEIATVSDYVYTGIYLAQEFFSRATQNQELIELAKISRLEAEDSYRKHRYASAEKWLEDISYELDRCLDATGQVSKPGRYREAWASFEKGRPLLPADFKGEAATVWAKHKDLVRALKTP